MHTGLSDTEELVSGDAPVDPFASANGAHLIALVRTAFDCGWSVFPAFPEGTKAIRRGDRARGTSTATKPVICFERERKGRRFQ